MAKFFSRLNEKISEYVGATRGVAGEDRVAGIRNPRPYEQYYSDGLFYSVNGDLWIYFKMPEDVKVGWTRTYRESAENQQFLTNVFDVLGDALNYQGNSDSSTKKDDRIKFHIPIIREVVDEMVGFPEATPAMDEFLDRMSNSVGEHIVWHSYFGVQVPRGDINADVYGISNRTRNYIDVLMNRTDVDLALYKEFLTLIRSVCIDNGMRPLDFDVDEEDFDRLVGWFGQNDARYGVRPELPTTPLYVPRHGKSVFAGDRELMFSSVRPAEAKSMFAKDPFDPYHVRFGEILMRPSLDIVHINIRGEIRSTIATQNLFDQKITQKENLMYSDRAQNNAESSHAERAKIQSDNEAAQVAAQVSSVFKHSLLDNVEMTVASLVRDKKSQISSVLSDARLEAVNITSRHHIALQSTVPCYPDPIYRVSLSNEKRNPNVRTFFGGVLAMSGLFRSVKPAAPGGILLGFSEEGFEMKEVYMNQTTKEYAPAVLVTGSTGSGKTTQMLMMNAQNTYLGGQSIFLNPKPKSSLKDFFDYLGGITINMSTEYLNKHPGLLDPVFYIEDREAVGRLLADMIIRATGMSEGDDNRFERIRDMEELTANLIENAMQPANETSFDIIFGNKRHGANTKELRNKEILKFVRTKISSSPFWKASISLDPGAKNAFADIFNSNKPLLIEWDNSISLPTEDKKNSGVPLTPSENDGVQSLINLFMYSAEVLGKNRAGGMLTVDEAYILKSSEMVLQHVNKAGRTWRAQGITLLLGTQFLSDFIAADEESSGSNSDLSAFIRAYIIMNIDPLSHKDIRIFYNLTGLPQDDDTREYITNMKRDPKKKRYIPSAFYVDFEYDWMGSIMCGPWPQREMRVVDPDKKLDDQLTGAIDQVSAMYENAGIVSIGEDLDEEV